MDTGVVAWMWHIDLLIVVVRAAPHHYMPYVTDTRAAWDNCDDMLVTGLF